MKAPLLVIHGTADPVYPIEHGVALADAVAGAKLVRLDGGGHELHRADWDTIIERDRGAHRSGRRLTTRSGVSLRSVPSIKSGSAPRRSHLTMRSRRTFKRSALHVETIT